MNRVSPHKQDHFSESGYPYFDPIDEYLNLWDCWDNCDLPMLTCIDDHSGTTCGGTTAADQGGRNGRWRSRPLELEEIEKHFELPIAVAAEKLGVGLTMLKKRCREFNIKRWPHRKLKSIKSLIQNVKPWQGNSPGKFFGRSANFPHFDRNFVYILCSAMASFSTVVLILVSVSFGPGRFNGQDPPLN
ncbi:putative transcription factor Nin-like family [Helianthus anomalus]